MENGVNPNGIELEALQVERSATVRQFADHVRNAHYRSLPPTSCHPCINFRQIILLQDFHIKRLSPKPEMQPEVPLGE